MIIILIFGLSIRIIWHNYELQSLSKDTDDQKEDLKRIIIFLSYWNGELFLLDMKTVKKICPFGSNNKILDIGCSRNVKDLKKNGNTKTLNFKCKRYYKYMLLSKTIKQSEYIFPSQLNINFFSLKFTGYPVSFLTTEDKRTRLTSRVVKCSVDAPNLLNGIFLKVVLLKVSESQFFIH